MSPATSDPSAVIGALVAVFVVFALIGIAVYVWNALALSRLFPRLGGESWKGWVPILNTAEIFARGGVPAWSVVFLFIPIVNLYGLYLFIVATHRINVLFGRGAGSTVLAVLIQPLWATLLAWGSASPDPERGRLQAVPTLSERVGPLLDPAAAPRDASGYAIPPREAAHDGFAPPPSSAAAVAAASVIPVAAPATEKAPDLPGVSHVSIAETMGQPASTETVVPDATNPWAPRTETVAPAGLPTTQPHAVPPVAPPVAPPVVPQAEVPPAVVPPVIASPPVFFEPVIEATPAPAHASAPEPAPAPAFAPVAPAPAVVPPAVPPMAPAPAVAFRAPDAPVAPTGPESGSGAADPADADDADDDFGHYDTVITSGPTASAPSTLTLDDDSDEDDEDDDDLEATVVVDRRPRVRWRLALDDGTQLDLTASRVVLGRNPVAADSSEQALAVPDQTRTLSKTHARLVLQDGEWTVTDLGSTNGVLLYDEHGEEQLVDPGIPVSTADGFVLGKVGMRVTFVEEAR